jgi:hypothetical protein
MDGHPGWAAWIGEMLHRMAIQSIPPGKGSFHRNAPFPALENRYPAVAHNLAE